LTSDFKKQKLTLPAQLQIKTYDQQHLNLNSV